MEPSLSPTDSSVLRTKPVKGFATNISIRTFSVGSMSILKVCCCKVFNVIIILVAFYPQLRKYFRMNQQIRQCTVGLALPPCSIGRDVRERKS